MLREHNAGLIQMPTLQINPAANLLMAFAEGKILQFVRSDFTELPTKDWEAHWGMLNRTLFD